MDTSGKILFEEIQLFRFKWLWVLIIVCSLAAIAVIIGIALTQKEKAGEIWVALAFIVPFEVIILYLFYIARLETVITSKGIYYRWWPFQRKGWFIRKQEIETAEMRNGPPLCYGFHWIPGYGWVHTTGPGKGIQLRLQTGKKIFLGTQTPASLQTALEKIMTVMQKV